MRGASKNLKMDMAGRIRVIIIDPHRLSVQEAMIKPDLKSYYDIIGCNLIEAVYFKDDSLSLGYVDEEGLFGARDFVKFKGVTAAGVMVVVGYGKDGDTASTTMDFDEAVEGVEFFYKE